MYPILLAFKKSKRYGYPGSEDFDWEKGPELWESYLDKMILAFELSLADCGNKDKLSKKFCKKYKYDRFDYKNFKAIQDNYVKDKEKINEGLALFGKYILTMWD
jgi:hypothetical protein